MQRDVSHRSHYHEGHLHICLGPGIPQPPASRPALRQVYCQAYGQQISANQHVVSRPILGGRYYEYGLEKTAAREGIVQWQPRTQLEKAREAMEVQTKPIDRGDESVYKWTPRAPINHE